MKRPEDRSSSSSAPHTFEKPRRSASPRAVKLQDTVAAAVEPRPAALFERDWREEVNALVDDWCRTAQVPRARLSLEQRRELVRVLDGKGVFGVRHAAGHVAAALGVSRATVYSLLKTARSVAAGAAPGLTAVRKG